MEPAKAVSPRKSLLISAQDLAAELQPGSGSAPPVIVDCRFNLLQPGAGRATYLAGHLPGAHYADLDRDLSAPRAAGTGRHPLPDPEALCDFFGRMGITADTRVVAYDDGGGSLAARLWWLLRWMGHQHVVLLDGGLAAWEKAGLPLSQTVPETARQRFAGAAGQMPVMHAPELSTALARHSIRLLDVRAEDRFLGRIEPIDKVAGHVPGALNVPFAGNLRADLSFQSSEYLAERYAPVIEGRPPGEIVCMCGSGVTACHGILALELAGVPGAALYPGSWSEWISSPHRPVVTP